MIEKAAKENLKLIQPMIIALRTGDNTKLVKIKDLKPEWLTLNEYIKNTKEEIGLYGKVSIEHRRAQEKRMTNEILLELIKLGDLLGLNHIQNEKLAKKGYVN